MAERKDKEPVFGRLEGLDDVPSLPLTARNGGPRGGKNKTGPRPAVAGIRAAVPLEPEPEISVVSSLTTRAQVPPVEIDESSPGHPGAAMRFERQKAGLDAAALAARTRLSLRIIEDLEANRFESMPPAYVRGYMRAVARALDVIPDGWIRSYEGLGFAEPVLRATVHRNASARWGLRPGVWRLMVAAILISALGLGVYSWTEGDRANPFAGLAAWLELSWPTVAGDPPEADTAVESGPEFAPTEPERLMAPETAGSSADPLTGAPRPAEPEPAAGSTPGPPPVAVEPAPANGPTEAPVPPAMAPPAIARSQPEPAAPAMLPPAIARSEIEPAAPTRPPAPPEARAGIAAEGLMALDEAPLPSVVPTDSPDPASPGSIATSPPVAEADSVVRSTLNLSFEGTSWIEVRSAADRVALRGVFHAGDERTAMVEMPARIIVGNAPAVRLSRDGSPVALDPHTRGDRTARFTLDAD